MTRKKVSIRPKASEKPMTANDWVSGTPEAEHKNADQVREEKMKRLTLDITEPLHRAIKRKAVEEGTTMIALLRQLLEREYL